MFRTFSSMFLESGGRFINFGGRNAIEWVDQTNTVQRQFLP